jgi:hypothetical protein
MEVLYTVQCIRKLNALKDISEYIDEIGRANSIYYLAVDLTLDYWQMMLEPHFRDYMAFTCPGMGQYQ